MLIVADAELAISLFRPRRIGLDAATPLPERPLNHDSQNWSWKALPSDSEIVAGTT
jgi:hypothetical protein